MSIDQGPPPSLGVARYAGLGSGKLEEILGDIPRLKAGVIGDGCLDVYWHANMALSDLSRETPHYPLPVVKEVYSPGAAGNVAANLKALGCGEVHFCSVLGKDWRGGLLRECLNAQGIDDSFSLIEDNLVTPAYCKPIRYGLQGVHQEDPRIDFHNQRPLSISIIERLVRNLDRMAAAVDILVVTDQLHYGVIGSAVRDRLHYWAGQGKRVVVDSRDRIGLFRGVVVKPNEIEGLRWNHPDEDPAGGSWDLWLEAARKLSLTAGAPCCMTLGDQGSIWVEGDQRVWTSAIPANPPIDIVGAGDCYASALVCALGSGSSGPEAMSFAHLATSVVIRKIGTTGTASPGEILQVQK